MMIEEYRHSDIERKWRLYWSETRLHDVSDDDPRPKYYCLDMFPYPSGSGLHVGHWRSYVLPDCWSRFKLLQGFNVLHPMGWDAFGSPAENDAINKGIHPEVNTARNIANFKRQLSEVGAIYDWNREVNTTDPDYYRWTQWIFIQMFKHGLAYKTNMPINWCPSCKTGISNEDVVNGRCERCGAAVEKKELNQWMLRITRYAERLLNGLETLDWPEKVRTMQAHWIGRSEGAEVDFVATGPDGRSHTIRIFTTRPDTLYGATYMVLAPEHPLVASLVTDDRRDRVMDCVERARKQSDIDRTGAVDKTGEFTGSFAINPVNGEKIPVWVSDYVLMTYGTGAIMAVPAHDDRDYAFARKFDLPIREVIASAQGVATAAFTGDGTVCNSGPFDGMSSSDCKKAITASLESRSVGKASIHYRLRDWVFSRQRYWGEPIPIVHCPACGPVALDESELPLRLPEVERYQPTGTGESPLAAITSWVETRCPSCGGPARRETDTMPQWAGSSWYFLRYASPRETRGLISEAGRQWLPVDLYVGGVEHAILHLLYARFFTMFLHDIGVVDFDEPFKRLFNQGMITYPSAKTGKVEKMSKSKGNVVNPDPLVERFGCDSLRMYELFVGPPEADAEWNDNGIDGVYRYMKRAWNWVQAHNGRWAAEPSRSMLIRRHMLIRKVTERLEAFRLNTIVSTFMEFMNEVSDLQEAPDRPTVEAFLILMAPFAPHFSEELWSRIGNPPSVFQVRWPSWDDALTRLDTVEVAVQVNGKVRTTLVVDRGTLEAQVLAAALADPNVQRAVHGKAIRKQVYVPGRILNLVVG